MPLFFFPVVIMSLLFIPDIAHPKALNIVSMQEEFSSEIKDMDFKSLENRLVPFLERRINRHLGRKSVFNEKQSDLEKDLIMAGRFMNRLSAEFKQLYRNATKIPSSFQCYISPGGNFEIYYTLSGKDSIDSTDRYGYSLIDWKTRTDSPNGIPDYVDEVAFALDSCRSMEIERFRFIAPAPYKDADHPSDRYKVIIEEQEISYYGLTYLLDKLNDDRGYRSFISLRNDWSGEEWRPLGYDTMPQYGIRVTCAHEFFHAIQYAMSWNVEWDIWLDDFPVSWTEGTAVCMEELAFDSINDYHQYAHTYFNNPEISFFGTAVSDIVYTNAILLLYLFKHFPPGNSINFIHSITFTNYLQKTPFHENLLSTAINNGRPWSKALHDFHVASFSTGQNADTSVFISDAKYFNMRTIPLYNIKQQIKRTVASNSAVFIRLVPEINDPGELVINLKGDVNYNTSIADSDWSCSMMLKQKGEKTYSSSFVSIDREGRGTISVTDWKNSDEMILVITNGNPLQERTMILSFDYDTIPEYRDIIIFPNPVSLHRHNGKLYIRGSNIISISIYSVNGSSIWHYPIGNEKPSSSISPNQYIWKCKNTDGSFVAPGIYTVFVVRKDISSGSILRTRYKLMVAP